MPRLAPLLVVYDAESSRCCRWVDRVQKQDRHGLIVAFPFQNPELLNIAPELAGRALHLEIHGLDTSNRQVWAGAQLLPQIWVRLPGWRWVIFLMWIPWVSKLIAAFNRVP